MASKGEILAGRAYVEIYAKTSALMKGLAQVQQQLKKLASGLKQFGEEVGKIGRAITAVGLAIGVTLATGIAKVVAKTPQLKGVADAFESVRAAIERMFVQIATALAPALIDLSGRFTAIVNRVADFAAKNQEAIVSFARGLVIFTGVGIAITALGKAFALAGAAISVANTLITVSSTIASTAVSALSAAFSFLASPVGLIVASITAAGAAVLYFAGAFENLGGIIRAGAADIYATVTTAFGGITDALMSGQFALAGQIAWVGLQLAFKQGVDVVMSVWDQFVTNLYTTWVGLNSMITNALLGTAGVITRIIQKIIDVVNKIPGIDIEGNFEFDSAGAIKNAEEDAGNAIRERERRQGANSAARKGPIQDLQDELKALREEAAKAREQAKAGALPPPTLTGPATPQRITPATPAETPVSNLALALASIGNRVPDSREATKAASSAFGTFTAAGLGLAVGAGGPMQQQLIEAKKNNQLSEKMLEELRRIKFDFTA